MEKEIKNKTVIVTGASRGIGFDIAKEFLKQGARKVIILDINEEVGEKATAELNREYGIEKASFFKCDVTTDLDTTFSELVDKFKTLDVLVNNAGVVDENSIRKTITLNTVATVEWTMKFWDHVRKDKGGNGGTVMNIASAYGYLVDPFMPFYKTSKYAVVGFTRSIGHKINYEQTGVRVIAICPGFTKTHLAENIGLNKNQLFQQEIFQNFVAKNKWLTSEDVSKATADIFKNADSGTVWSVIAGETVQEVAVPPEFQSEYLIQSEL